MINPSGLTIAENDAKINAIYDSFMDFPKTRTNADVINRRKKDSDKPVTEFRTTRPSITNKNDAKNANCLGRNFLLKKKIGMAVNADNQRERCSWSIIYENRFSEENTWKNNDTKRGHPIEEIKYCGKLSSILVSKAKTKYPRSSWVKGKPKLWKEYLTKRPLKIMNPRRRFLS